MNSAERFGRRPTAVIDWDGTLVQSNWPNRPTEPLEGAVDALHRLNALGARLMIDSCRISPMNPYDEGERSAADVAIERQYVRSTLDSWGCSFVDIHHTKGKPGGNVYVDDRALWYPGRDRSWDALVNVIAGRLGLEMEPILDE